MITAYLWGVGTPIILGYIGFGVYIMVRLWHGHSSEHWMSQYRSPFTRPPLPVRSWTVFLALWIPTPLLWPLTVSIGKLLYWRYRHVHNTAATRARATQIIGGAAASTRDGEPSTSR
jgi:hypothetical protein